MLRTFGASLTSTCSPRSSLCKHHSLFHHSEKFWIIDLLLGHVIQNIRPLVKWYIGSSESPDPINVRLDTTVEIHTFIVEEERVLCHIPESFLLLPPPFILVVIDVVIICGFVELACLLVPHWVREVSY